MPVALMKCYICETFNPMDTVDILLGTYNSEKYIEENLESIVRQTYTNWRLLVRDDCSKDSTVEILNRYRNKYPNKIMVITGKENIGACQNFAELMGLCDSKYIMFCDGDDVWLPFKIETSMGKMKCMEDVYGKNTPILVHTDLRVVDKKLSLLADSLWDYQNIDPEKTTVPRLFLQNVVTGCSVMINNSLGELAMPIPHEAIMHDWWIALVAAEFGKIGCIKRQTLLYRQHGKNDIGAIRWDFFYLLGKIRPFSALRKNLVLNQAQARAFLVRFEQKLRKSSYDCLEKYINLFDYNCFKRRYYLFRYGLLKNGIIRNIGLLIYI